MRIEDHLYYLDARAVERHLRKVREHPSITQENKDLILRFCALCQADGLQHKRVTKTAWIMRNWGEWIGNKSFTAVSKNDLIDLVNLMGSQGFKPATMLDYKAILKKFYTNVIGNGQVPESAAWIRVKRLRTKRDPATVLTEDDVLQLLRAQESLNIPWVRTRNKAMIAFLYDSGVRLGELLKMRVCDISRSDELWRVTVKGKTGQRTIPVFVCIPYMKAYLAVHPLASNPEAPLWCTRADSEQHLSHSKVATTLRRAFKRARLQKPANPHNFRHSAVSRDANFMSDQQLKVKYGWTASSAQLETYSHIRLEVLEDALRRRHGLIEKLQAPSLAIWRCRQCGRLNEPHVETCSNRCGLTTDPAAPTASLTFTTGPARVASP